jgi:hypothetical protein
MTGKRRAAYNFAFVRAVPHVPTGAFTNVGVIVHSRAAEFLGIRVLRDQETLRARIPDLDIDLLSRYLECFEGVTRGDPAAGPMALVSPSERFHWLTSPRSDVLQVSPVHEGVGEDIAGALETLFATYVRP